MKYYFYVTNDKTKEPIGIIDAGDKQTAIELFSKRKKLSVKSFNKISSVDVQKVK